MTDHRVPLEYFLSASETALQNFALARLVHAANIAKEIKAMEEERVIQLEAAGVAQWLLNHRGELLRTVGSHLAKVSDAA